MCSYFLVPVVVLQCFELNSLKFVQLLFAEDHKGYSYSSPNMILQDH